MHLLSIEFFVLPPSMIARLSAPLPPALCPTLISGSPPPPRPISGLVPLSADTGCCCTRGTGYWRNGALPSDRRIYGSCRLTLDSICSKRQASRLPKLSGGGSPPVSLFSSSSMPSVQTSVQAVVDVAGYVPLDSSPCSLGKFVGKEVRDLG